MSKSVFKRKLIHCLTSVVIAISLVFAPLGASAQILAQTNDGNIGIAGASSDTADSNNSGDFGENGDGGDDNTNGDGGSDDATDDDDGKNGDAEKDPGEPEEPVEPEEPKEPEEPEDTLELINEASDSVEGLTLLSVPYLDFGKIKFSSIPETLQASISGSVTVSDIPGEGWSLSVRYEDIANKLPGRLFFKQGDVEKDITESSEIIYSHTPGNFDEAETTVTKKWDNSDEGFWLEVLSDDISDYDINEMIMAALIWEITPIVE